MDDPILFAGNPLDRASERRGEAGWIDALRGAGSSVFLPVWRGDPLVAGGALAWLTPAALGALPGDAPIIFLGLGRDGAAHFAVDVSAAADAPQAAPLAELGEYAPLRETADRLDGAALAIAGQARWLFDWHRRHRFCAVCGAPSVLADGGAKRICGGCGAEHFPRTDPVAIVLAVNGDACLLGRSPRFPPGFYSALAGFVEAAETVEECAVRELKEEAGVTLTSVRYRFSQPWPFPSSLMIGCHGDAESHRITIDPAEIEDALWLPRERLLAVLAGEDSTIAPARRGSIASFLLRNWLADRLD